MRKINLRGRNKRFSVITAFAAVAAAALSGCASGGNAHPNSSSGTGDVRVVYLGSKGTTYENAIFDGLSSVKGISMDFIETGYDEVKQAQAVDDAVASGRYQAIVAIPASPTSLLPAVRRAIDAGVQFLNVASPFGPDHISREVQLPGQSASLVPDYENDGAQQFKLALQYCKERGIEPCEIARIDGLPQYPSALLFAKADKAGAAAAGSGVKLYDTVFAGGYDATVGLKAGQDLITAHPDLDVIISQDPMMKGIEQAVSNSGSTIGLISQGGTAAGLEKVRNGSWYANVAVFPRTTGILAGETILRHEADPSLEGETINPVLEGASPAFTKKNVDTFTAEYE